MFSSTGFRTCKISYSICFLLRFFRRILIVVLKLRDMRCWLMGLWRLWHALMQSRGACQGHRNSSALAS